MMFDLLLLMLLRYLPNLLTLSSEKRPRGGCTSRQMSLSRLVILLAARAVGLCRLVALVLVIATSAGSVLSMQ